MRLSVPFAVAGVMLAALAASGSAQAAVAMGGTAFQQAGAQVDDQFPGFQSDPHAGPGAPASLHAHATATGFNGLDHGRGVTATGDVTATWANANSGAIVVDNSWTTFGGADINQVALGMRLNEPRSDAPNWSYQFTAAGDGAFDFTFDIQGLGDNDAGLGDWDLLLTETGQPTHDIIFHRGLAVGAHDKGGFSLALLAGRQYTAALVSDEELTVIPGDVRTGSEKAAFGWTIHDAPAGVPEPSTWALMIFGFAGVGAALRRRLERLAA